MMTKPFYLLFVLVFSIQFAYTQQNSVDQTVITLQDGSVYIGNIISEDAFEIVMETESVGTITVPAYLVKNRNNKRAILLQTIGKYHKTTGYFFTLDYSLSLGSNSNSLTQLNLIFGKRLTTKLNLGVGVGISNISRNNFTFIDQQLAQPYVYGQYFLNNKKWRLFVDMKLGYGIDLGETRNFGFNDEITSHGGAYINPGIGFELANRKKMKWSFKLSQFIQKASHTDSFQDGLQNPVFIKSNVWYNRTTLTIGLNW